MERGSGVGMTRSNPQWGSIPKPDPESRAHW